MSPALPRGAFRLRQLVEAAVVDLPAGEPIVVACSGGPDSLALAAVSARLDRPVSVAIVDHGLQPDSDQVAARTASVCRSFGISALVLPVRVDQAGAGVEAAARTARYRALDDAADRAGSRCVLLAHTMDDQAETVLLGLARGSGTRSLAGMRASRGRFRRPFLSVRRTEIAEVIAELELHPWHDPHNDDDRYLRVAVRHHVIPALAGTLGPQVVRNLARSAELARADADLLDDLTAAEADQLGDRWSDVDSLRNLHPALRRRLLRSRLVAAGAPAGQLTFEHVVATERLVTDWHGQGPLQLPGRVVVTRRYGRLVVSGTTERSADAG